MVSVEQNGSSHGHRLSITVGAWNQPGLSKRRHSHSQHVKTRLSSGGYQSRIASARQLMLHMHGAYSDEIRPRVGLKMFLGISSPESMCVGDPRAMPQGQRRDSLLRNQRLPLEHSREGVHVPTKGKTVGRKWTIEWRDARRMDEAVGMPV